RSSVERQPLEPDIDAVDRVRGGHRQRARRHERQAYDSRSRKEKIGAAVRVDTDHALAGCDGRGYVETALIGERHALRTPQAAVENVYFAVLRDAMDRVEAARGGTGDVKIS